MVESEVEVVVAVVVVGVLDDVSDETESKGVMRLDEEDRDKESVVDRESDKCARADG